jgi:hypothetical protein
MRHREALAREVLDLLYGQTLPAVRARHDRSFRAWLRDSRRTDLVFGWCLVTIGLLSAAVLPRILDGQLVGLVSAFIAIVVMVILWGGIGWISYRYTRWEAGQLADQIQQESEDLRARIAGGGNA